MSLHVLIQALVAWVLVTASAVTLLEIATPLVLRYARRAALAGHIGRLVALSWWPHLVGVIVVAGCYTPSLLARLGWMHDHCEAHGGHIHLCVNHVHAADAGVLGVALSLVAVAWLSRGTVALYRGLRRGLSIQRALEIVVGHERDDYRLVDAEAALSLTTGLLSPRIFVTTGLFARLSPQQQAVTLEHERCHAREHHALLKLVAAVGAVVWRDPTRRAILGELALGCERRSDEAAARLVGDRLEVASTLLAGHRALRDTQLHAVLALAGSSLRERVVMLTDATRIPSAPWKARAIGVSIAVFGLWLGHRLHHAIETALSMLLV